MSAPALLDIVNKWPPLVALISDGTTVKVYPDNVPEGTGFPYIAYAMVALQPIVPLAGIPDADYCRLSFECYGKTRTEAVSVADAMRDALDHGGKDGTPWGYLIMGMVEQYEPETRAFFVSFEWGLWQGRNSTPGGTAAAIP